MTQTSAPEPQQEEVEQNLQLEEDQFGVAFRRQYPSIWWATLVGPFVLAAVLLGAAFLLRGPGFVWRLVTTAVLTFFFFGRFVILGGSSGDVATIHKFFTSGELFWLVVTMDLMTASLLVFHSSFLFRLPWIGARLLEVVEDGRFILRSNPWMKRVTFFGLVGFVMFPLAATGAVGGSIFGRLLGMSRLATFIGVMTGSLLGCAPMYFGANALRRVVHRDDPLLTIAGIAVVVAVVLLLNYRYRKYKAQHIAARRIPPPAANRQQLGA